MNPVHTTLLPVAAFLAVFAQASLDGPRRLLGAQLDFLTPLLVYAAMSAELPTVALLAVCGGLWLDALSANPLGASILPLFLPAFVIQSQRSFILRDQTFAQAVIGAGASTAAAVFTLLMLMTIGPAPAFGWGTLGCVAVVTLGGAALTPLYFAMFERMERAFFYQPRRSPGFDPDRQIKRDRHPS